jgi:hypothetical protein
MTQTCVVPLTGVRFHWVTGTRAIATPHLWVIAMVQIQQSDQTVRFWDICVSV